MLHFDASNSRRWSTRRCTALQLDTGPLHASPLNPYQEGTRTRRRRDRQHVSSEPPCATRRRDACPDPNSHDDRASVGSCRTRPRTPAPEVKMPCFQLRGKCDGGPVLRGGPAPLVRNPAFLRSDRARRAQTGDEHPPPYPCPAGPVSPIKPSTAVSTLDLYGSRHGRLRDGDAAAVGAGTGREAAKISNGPKSLVKGACVQPGLA